MGNMKNVSILVLSLLVATLVYAQLSKNSDVATLGSTMYYAGDFVNTSVTVGTASTTVVLPASTSGREYALITNTATNTAYVSLGEYAVSGKGIAIPANGSYEFTDNQFQGAVYGIASTNVTLSVVYNQ